MRLAIRREADAANFYKSMSGLAGPSKAFFQEMAQEETTRSSKSSPPATRTHHSPMV